MTSVCRRRLKRDLVGHDARSVPEMGWAGKQNGDLLALAETEFDVFLTVDRNLSFQQSIAKLKIAVVVMVAKGNKLAHLQPLVPKVLGLLSTLTHGQVVKVIAGQSDGP